MMTTRTVKIVDIFVSKERNFSYLRAENVTRDVPNVLTIFIIFVNVTTYYCRSLFFFSEHHFDRILKNTAIFVCFQFVRIASYIL